MSRTDDDLNELLAGARAAAPAPSPALMARILADADGVQREALAALGPAPRTRVRPRGPFGRMLAALGGWSVMSGLATATIAGAWLGFSAPEPLAGVADAVLGTALMGADTIDTVDLMPSIDDYLTEG